MRPLRHRFYTAPFFRSAVLPLVGNCLYALYHGLLGFVYASLWYWSTCIFYSILTVARFCDLLTGRASAGRNRIISWRFVMTVCGILLLVLSGSLAWVIEISLSQHIATAYDTVTMITIATYTFYKITVAAVQRVQHWDTSPLSVVIRNIRYAEVAASVLTLQRSMLVSFGTSEHTPSQWMNALTGAAVCAFILSLGIYLIWKSRKEVEPWQNPNL